MSTLLATKLHRPAIPTRSVPRPHLVRRLNDGLIAGHPLMLISAPAGFGKTSCASAWIDTLRLPVSWLSLDSADDDPGRFFSYFVTALQGIDKNLGQEIEGLLHAGQLASSEILCTILANNIQKLEDHFLLVLDDFHVIQDLFILQVLERLISQPPEPLHLILLTREDPALPLARLRANNMLTEIRARDLRFSGLEVENFLNNFMDLDLTQEDIARLEARTEGWVVGLQLAGFSMRDRADPSSFITNLSGSHRFILSYLTEEVLNQQPPAIQQFLLQTSILDKLCGSLCNTLTGREDSHLLLEQLFNTNLFLTPLDEQGQWYRFHHLFAEMLLNLLQNSHPQDQISALNRRASQWYAQAKMPRDAIEHALDAGDFGFAVELLEFHAMEMVMQGYAKTVDGWIQRMPPEWDSQSPKTQLAFTWMYALRGNYSRAFLYLERLEATFQDGKLEEPAVQAEWMALKCLMLNMHRKTTESLLLAQQALDIAPEEADNVHSLIYMGLAGVYQLRGDYTRAIDAFRRAIQYGRMAGNTVAEMMSAAGLASLVLEHGQLNLAFEIASPVSERISRLEVVPPISAVIFGVLGEVHYHWHQLDKALEYTGRAIQLSTLGGYNTGAIYYRSLLARLHSIVGNLEIAAREIEKAVDLLQVQVPDDILEEIIAPQVRIYLAQNRLAAAEMALGKANFSFQKTFSFPELAPEQRITHSIGLLYNSGLRVLLHRNRARPQSEMLEPGIELASHLIDRACQAGYSIVAIEAFLLRAQLYASLGNQQTGLADYIAALELAEPEGFISIFVDQGESVAAALASLLEERWLGTVQPSFVKRILDAFSAVLKDINFAGQMQIPPNDLSAETAAAALIEPLTDRELEVLCLMAEGLKYSEIADKLYISVNTVRYHVKAIYGKLDVNNRMKAVEKAGRLRILEFS